MTTGSQKFGKFEDLTLSSTNKLGAESVSPPSIKVFTRKRENGHTLINNTEQSHIAEQNIEALEN